ncbi:MAG: isochorismate synthase [Deltaproteobacteria bacterium]|jgi:menaquinone-specific isochorismate synthase|nr:isochorismate synthase [Deltaproteobacteria bacterium]MBT7204116.1 isochorismate synthase [Deltaproteobacteria bacterium]
MSLQLQPQPTPLDWPSALEHLLEMLPRWQHRNKSPILQLCIPIVEPDPLDWLQYQEGVTRVYWSDREHQFQMAGLGAALQIKGSTDEVMQKVSGWQKLISPNTAFLGGIPFHNSTKATQQCGNFQQAAFVLPFLMVQQDSNGSFLWVHLAQNIDGASTTQELFDLLDRLKSPSNQRLFDSQRISIVERNDAPNLVDWSHSVEAALSQIRASHFEKIVLARQSHFQLNKSPDPFDLLNQLRQQAPHAYHFGWHDTQGPAFLSITPERLFKRKRQNLESEALAGTRPRGQNAYHDEQLTHELFHDTKEVREHLVVLRFMEERFSEHCRVVERLSHLEPLRLKHVQHLQSRLRGRLLDEVTDAQLLNSLHPTPAVCGLPQAVSRMQINNFESFDRGWYAGPVGYVSKQQSEFAVGIRSGVLEGDSLTVYTGAGIVEGSDPDREWQELDHKLRSWEALLGNPP